MNYLDQTGLEYLWGKIKTHVGTVVEGWVGEIVVNWDDVKGKPSTFTPSTHTHTVSQITDFPTNIVTNVTISGSGNAVTNASFSDNTLTITKGTIGDGNYYPTAFKLSYHRNQLIGVLRMSGTPDKTANGPHFATINGVGIIGDSEKDITIDWNNLQRKPSWAEDGITWDDIVDQPSMVNDVHVSGSGNAVVDASYQGGTLTLTKGTISAGTSGITQSEADGRYVNISGDTMTGDLNVTGHTVNAQTVDVTNVEALQITVSGNTNNNAINVNNGGVTAKAFYESSDISLKENITPITKEATDAVDCLTFKQFNFKDDKDKTTKYGVVAQEVEAAGLSNLVSANEEGVKSVDYISLLILKIEALEKRIAELEAERG